MEMHFAVMLPLLCIWWQKEYASNIL